MQIAIIENRDIAIGQTPNIVLAGKIVWGVFGMFADKSKLGTRRTPPPQHFARRPANFHDFAVVPKRSQKMAIIVEFEAVKCAVVDTGIRQVQIGMWSIFRHSKTGFFAASCS